MSLHDHDHLFIKSARFLRFGPVDELFLDLDIEDILTAFRPTLSRINHLGRLGCIQWLFALQHLLIPRLDLLFEFLLSFCLQLGWLSPLDFVTKGL